MTLSPVDQSNWSCFLRCIRFFHYSDLRHLVKDLRPLAAQWRSLGVYLGVPPEELDCIESRVATPENCFARVLDRFLSTHPHTGADDRRVCTEVIIEALRFPAVAKGNLSRDIESGKISKSRIVSTVIVVVKISVKGT